MEPQQAEPQQVALQTLLDQQGGVVTRAQAMERGLTARQLHGAERLLVRLRHGVYADAARLSTSDPASLTALRVASARLVTGIDLVAVGVTAALIHGVPLLGRPTERLQLAERKERRPRHHGSSATLLDDEITEVQGLPVSTLCRTAVDVARNRGFRAGVVTADAVLARGVDRTELETAAEACTGWPGARNARRAVEFADGRAESPLESLGRVGFAEHDLPAPDLQTWLGDVDGQIGRVDHYWGEHRTVAEADGAMKYVEPGVLSAEKQRENCLRDAGFQVVRYTWDEALLRPEQIARRIRQAFARDARRPVGSGGFPWDR